MPGLRGSVQAGDLCPGFPQLKQVIMGSPGAGVASRAVDRCQVGYAREGRVNTRADEVEVGIAGVAGVQPSNQVGFTCQVMHLAALQARRGISICSKY